MSFRPEEVRELLTEHTADALVALAKPGETADHLVFDGLDVGDGERDARARRHDKAVRVAEAHTKRTVGQVDWMRFRSAETEELGNRRRRRQVANPLGARSYDQVFGDDAPLPGDPRRAVAFSAEYAGLRTKERSALYVAVASRLGELNQA